MIIIGEEFYEEADSQVERFPPTGHQNYIFIHPELCYPNMHNDVLNFLALIKKKAEEKRWKESFQGG